MMQQKELRMRQGGKQQQQQLLRLPLPLLQQQRSHQLWR
jgi:hypothetical protein